MLLLGTTSRSPFENGISQGILKLAISAPKAKDAFFQKVMVNFTLPLPEVDPEEGEPDEEEMDARKKALLDKVKAWALKKMAELFNKFKKRLYIDFILKDKTPISITGMRK